MADGGAPRLALPGPETALLEEEALRTREGQPHQVRQRLLRDARAAGLDEQRVHTAVDEAAVTFAQAPVQTFVGILVERTVRERLGLRAAPPGGPGDAAVADGVRARDRADRCGTGRAGGTPLCPRLPRRPPRSCRPPSSGTGTR